ncbi:MAG: CidA/LrgA family protein [Betaproteobacteria bacterium]
MVATFTLLLVFQVVGEVIAFGFSLPVPGPVIGMALLFVTLVLKGGIGAEIRHTAQGLLQHLSLLFVPAGVGVMLHLERLADEWLALTASLVVSTVVALLVTAAVMTLVARRRA